MQNKIKRYPVEHPLLRDYIYFFWELRIEHIQLNHKIIPQRNINMRLNLSNTAHYICRDGDINLLDDIYFPGLQNQFTNSYLKINGEVDVIGICFKPDGLYPFLKTPVSEFKNQILGTMEIGLEALKEISSRLKETSDIKNRLEILEHHLLQLVINSFQIPKNFRSIFTTLKQNPHYKLTTFCEQENLNLRKLERMFLKYVGLSAKTYTNLNRFHNSLNQLLDSKFSKLSDLAYDNEYFDQMHFIREFKRFTGISPGKFANRNNTILQIGDLD